MSDIRQNAHDLVCYGEILWDLLPAGARPGGAPMNVAYHIHQLGLRPGLITRVGQDERGQELYRILQGKQLDTSLVQEDEEQPTGIVHAVPNAAGDMQYDIVAPAAWDFIAPDARAMEAVRQSPFFVFGSLITREVHSRQTLFGLLEVAQQKVLDINLRTPFYSPAIIEALLQQAAIVKMNGEELALMAEWFGAATDQAIAMEQLRKKFSLSTLIVTLGAQGAMVNQEGSLFRQQGIPVTVADTVGSGDAFLAGFLTRLMQGKPVREALQFATALGALVASRVGGWPDYEVGEVEALAAGQ
ncbi:MAG: carbohydrate kinase [Candidatus Pseudobacter hemicellulosilyticus]|uniref:Carbohydrate kinase n=1 Tax=Candidatus Pseudobacter hemicellulosilyticus TaxID=3121375 RepID=A0AAJ5WP44_9BACT|nr:MAG: carbohydrate kinase [Pseudobacter sp.]